MSTVNDKDDWFFERVLREINPSLGGYVLEGNTFYYVDKIKNKTNDTEKMKATFIEEIKNNTHQFHYVLHEQFTILYPYSKHLDEKEQFFYLKYLSLVKNNTTVVNEFLEAAWSKGEGFFLLKAFYWGLPCNLKEKEINHHLKHLKIRYSQAPEDVQDAFISGINKYQTLYGKGNKTLENIWIKVCSSVFGSDFISEFTQRIGLSKPNQLFSDTTMPSLSLFNIDTTVFYMSGLKDNVFEEIEEFIDKEKLDFPKCYLITYLEHHMAIGVENKSNNSIEKVQALIQNLIDLKYIKYYLDDHEADKIMLQAIEKTQLEFNLKASYHSTKKIKV